MAPWTSLLLGAIFLAGLVPLLGGAVSLGQLLRLWVRDRANPAGVPSGLVSLAGTARAVEGREPVRSPLTGTESLAFAVEIAREGGRPARPEWETVATRQDEVPFVLDGEHGRVFVDPVGVTLAFDPADERVVDGESAEDLPNVPGFEPPEGERYRVRERRVDVGQPIELTGIATDRTVAVGDESLPVVVFPSDRGPFGRFLGVPFAVSARGGGRVRRRLRDRTIMGLVIGLPLAMLAIVFAFPPGT